MIPDRDYYADKNGKLTDDPTQFAIQVAVAGVNLDERVARRYGITDTLVSVDEPNAPRRVTGGGASVKIVRAEEKAEEPTEVPQEPPPAEPNQEAAEDADVKAEEPKATTVKKSAAKTKGAKKK